jgi:uncharacterized protein (DUF983 family)
MPTDLPPPRAPLAWRRGLRLRCPNCGHGRLYDSYLKVTERCSACNEPLGHIRADDIPAYFTILIVAHVMVPVVAAFVAFSLPDWLSITLCLMLTVALTLGLLPSVKGVIVAHLWRLTRRGSLGT